jgi:hypothetical protein
MNSLKTISVKQIYEKTMEHLFRIVLKKSIIVCALLLGISIIQTNRAKSEEYSTSGKDFYFNFMPNFHSSLGDEDSIYVYISADEVCTAYVEATDINNKVKRFTINITNPNQYFTLAFPYNNYEMPGDYNSTYYGKGSQKVVAQGFHAYSDKKINVYGLSSSVKSSDAFLVYPTVALDKEYYVLAYNSDDHGSYTPSQFSMVATEDNTEISIAASSNTINSKIINVTLNKGQSYLVQNYKEYGNNNGDLSGTYILANKPIAVFGGQQRATIPYNTAGRNPSRDFIVDQIPPISKWGKNAFIIPFPEPQNVSPQGNDIYRIISSANANKIVINGSQITLNKGAIYEGNILNTAIEINAEKPILVCQYKKTSEFNADGADDVTGDPLMLVIPPKEQFIQYAKLMNLQKTTDNGSIFNPKEMSIFTDQYIIVVAPDTTIYSCKLDGVKINSNSFTSINNSGYSYARLAVKDGVHPFSSYGKCGLYVIGYGYANSYGYVGGMALNTINDTIPPAISTVKDCFKLTGKINDAISESAGIKSVKMDGTKSDNVNVQIGNILEGQTSVNYNAELIDQNKDGVYYLEVVDSKNNKTTYADTIQGKTLIFSNAEPIVNFGDSVLLGSLSNSKIQLTNKGLKPYIIDKAYTGASRVFSIPPSQLPITIKPQETKTIIVCFAPNKAQSYIDSVFIPFDCYSTIIPVKGKAIALQSKDNTECGANIVISLNSLPKDFIVDNLQTVDSQSKITGTIGVTQQTSPIIVIYDEYGRWIKEFQLETLKPGYHEFVLDISDINSGFYLVSIKSDKNQTVKKIIVNR